MLLAGFVAVERRSPSPLLPLRILNDRNRSGAYLVVLLVGIGLFGVFLLLTYFLQRLLGYSPVTTGLAFLPLVAVDIVTSTATSALLLGRVGPRPLVVVGMAVTGAGLALLTQLGLHSTYVGDVLPPLLLIGIGVGFAIATAINTATAGIGARRQRGRVRAGQHQPADRGLGRHRAAQHAGDRRGQRLCPQPPDRGCRHRAGNRSWQRSRVLDRRRDLRLGAVVCGVLLRGQTPLLTHGAEPVPAHHWSLGGVHTPGRHLRHRTRRRGSITSIR